MDAFSDEYRKIEKSLFMVAVGYLHNAEDARDALQEAALAAYRDFPNLRQRAQFKTWLTRIVINKCKDFLKGRRITEELSDDLNIFAELPERDLEIVDAVCRLDSASVPYIALRFYHGMTYAETARVLRQPVSTVKYRTARALDELKLLLKGDPEYET